MRPPGISEEKQIQFEKDATAFNSLRPRQQQMAVVLAKTGYGCRRGMMAANKVVMGAADRLFHILVTVPFAAVKSLVVRTENKIAKDPKQPVPPKPDTKTNPRWKPAKEKLYRRAKNTAEFLEHYGALGLYRLTEWIFNPRLPSGKPLFGSETANKIVGTGLGICTFAALAAGIVWIEVMGKVWHAEIAQSILGSKSAWLVRAGKQALLHPALTVGLTVAQFLVIPSLAAARQALKSTKVAQAIAYQYNSLLRAQPAEPKQVAGWKPSAYVARLFNEIVERSSPESYKAWLKYFEEKRQQKQAVKVVLPSPEGKVCSLTLEQAFNNKSRETPASQAPVENTPTPPAQNPHP